MHIIVRETWGEYETATSFSGSLVPRRARRGMDVCYVIHRADWEDLAPRARSTARELSLLGKRVEGWELGWFSRHFPRSDPVLSHGFRMMNEKMRD